jgi:hypothetical protein
MCNSDTPGCAVAEDYLLPVSLGRPIPSGLYFRWGEWSAPDDISAADVIRFEQEYLGNIHLRVSSEVIAKLEGRPSRNLIWVCRTREEAKRFIPECLDGEEGCVEAINIPFGSQILAEDGDGGMLVLLPLSSRLESKVLLGQVRHI